MHISPGINHWSMAASSTPEFNHLLMLPEKNTIRRIKMRLMETFIRNEEEATSVRSFLSLLAVTNLMWAFFRRLVLVISNIVVMARNKAQIPISGFGGAGSPRTSRMKLINPKMVTEKRCRMV